MTLEELNELLKVFGMYIVVKDDDVFFYDLNDNTQLDVYRLTTDWKKVEAEKSSSRNDLFKGYVFKVIYGDFEYRYQIKYDYNLDSYSFNNLWIYDNKNGIKKSIKYEDDSEHKRIEYTVNCPKNYSYLTVLTSYKNDDWKEAYFDELDLNKTKTSSVYSVDGNKDKYEVSHNDSDFDYTKLYKSDPTISKIIDCFDSSIYDLLPDLQKVYGKYWPTNAWSQKVADEIDVHPDYELVRWFRYFGCTRVESNLKDINDEDFVYALEYLAYQVKRFGVDVPEPEYGKHVVNANAIAYFKWLHDYFYGELDHAQRDPLGRYMDELSEKGKDISYLMPEGSWQDVLKDNYYLIEILLGHDLNDLKEEAKKENRLEELAKAYDELNKMSWEDLAWQFLPTPYDLKLRNEGIRPTDPELDEIAKNLPKIHGKYFPKIIGSRWLTLSSKNCTEPELFSMITHLYEMRSFRFGDIDWSFHKDFTLEDYKYTFDYLMNQTKRFGVDVPEPEGTEPLPISESFIKWYSFYYNYYYKNQTPEDYENGDRILYEISALRPKKLDYSKFLPKGNWQDYEVDLEDNPFVNNKIYGLYWPKEIGRGKPIREDNEYLLIYGLERFFCMYARALILEKEGLYKDRLYSSDGLEYAIEHMFNQARQYGIDVPVPQKGKHLICPEILAWYKFNVDYFWRVLSHGQGDHLLKEIISPLLRKGLDISKYMPEGDWHDLLDKEYYLFEILLGHDLNDLKKQAKEEDRLDDLVKAYYKLNNFDDLEFLAAEYGPTPYLENVIKNDYRPTDPELDELVAKLYLNKPKIHGEYCPSNIFAEKEFFHFQYMTEPEFYNIIKHYNECSNNGYEDLYLSLIESESAEDKLYAKEYLMYQTKRFGVEFPDNKENKPIEESESYKKWFGFYDNYYGRFSEETRDWMIYKIAIRRAAKADYSKYLPAGNWQDYKVTSDEKIFMINKDMKKTSL